MKQFNRLGMKRHTEKRAQAAQQSGALGQMKDQHIVKSLSQGSLVYRQKCLAGSKTSDRCENMWKTMLSHHSWFKEKTARYHYHGTNGQICGSLTLEQD